MLTALSMCELSTTGYVGGAENALDRVDKSGWTVVSMKNDWNALFGE
jgi:hypothetical protein